MNYTIIDFSPVRGTITVAFEDYVNNPQTFEASTEGLNTATITNTILNYNAPRKNGEYLEGSELEEYIRHLAGEPLTGSLTQEELDQMILEMATDDPSTITGGGDILAKYVAYLRAQGTPEDVIEILVKI